jgi:hypothetical protein
MGFCIGIGLILAWVALCVVVANWQTILWIIGGLVVLVWLMALDDNARQALFGSICAGGFALFVLYCLVRLFNNPHPPRWRWVQNLNAAYQKRTGGKV